MNLQGLLFFGLVVAGLVAIYLVDPVLHAEHQRVMVVKSTGEGSKRTVDIRLKDGTIANLQANAFAPHASGMACAQIGQTVFDGSTKISLVDKSNCPLPSVRKISRMTTTSPTGTKSSPTPKKTYKKFSKGSPNSGYDSSSSGKKSFGSSMGFSN